ncbi:hypothetical protein Tco_0467403, partial [Tanacetum coccineum]
MANCNPTRTSVDTESKLGSDGDPIYDPTLYRSLAGGLRTLHLLIQIFLMQCNRFAFICMILESLIWQLLREFCDMFVAHWTLGSNLQ